MLTIYHLFHPFMLIWKIFLYAYSIISSLTHSIVRSFIYPSICSFIYSRIHSFSITRLTCTRQWWTVARYAARKPLSVALSGSLNPQRCTMWKRRACQRCVSSQRFSRWRRLYSRSRLPGRRRWRRLGRFDTFSWVMSRWRKHNGDLLLYKLILETDVIIMGKQVGQGVGANAELQRMTSCGWRVLKEANKKFRM